MTKRTRAGERVESDGARRGDEPRNAVRAESGAIGGDEPRDVARILAAFEAPGVPAELRGRALRAAGEALERPARRDAWRRIYESRALRAAWCAAAAALVVANVLAFSRRGNAPRPRPAAGDAPVEAELRAELTLPRLDEACLAGNGGAERAPAELPALAVPRKEKNS